MNEPGVMAQIDELTSAVNTGKATLWLPDPIEYSTPENWAGQNAIPVVTFNNNMTSSDTAAMGSMYTENGNVNMEEVIWKGKPKAVWMKERPVEVTPTGVWDEIQAEPNAFGFEDSEKIETLKDMQSKAKWDSRKARATQWVAGEVEEKAQYLADVGDTYSGIVGGVIGGGYDLYTEFNSAEGVEMSWDKNTDDVIEQTARWGSKAAAQAVPAIAPYVAGASPYIGPAVAAGYGSAAAVKAVNEGSDAEGAGYAFGYEAIDTVGRLGAWAVDQIVHDRDPILRNPFDDGKSGTW